MNKTWEYNDRTDSYQEVQAVLWETPAGQTNVTGTAKQTVEIVGFGDPVAQPGQYVGITKDVEPCYRVEKEPAPYQNTRPVLTAFEQELRRLINAHSMENASNTPDNILAEYLSACLNAFNVATRQREQWYGRRTF